MQAAERAHNFVVDFCLQTTSTVVEVLRCRSPFRSPPSSPIHQTLTPMRCRTVAVHRRWYRSLWASTNLAVESPTDLFVASHWLERTSCRFPAFLLVFSRAAHSTSQVLTTFYVVFISAFHWRLASKAQAHQTSRGLRPVSTSLSRIIHLFVASGPRSYTSPCSSARLLVKALLCEKGILFSWRLR